MKEKNASNKDIIIVGVLIILLSMFLGVLFIYGHPFSNKPKNNNNNSNSNKNIDDNKNNQDSKYIELTDEEIANLNIQGVYYNNEYSDLYFQINDNKEAILVESTCSEGAQDPKNVSYKILKNNDNLYKLVIYYEQDDDEVDTVELEYQYKIDENTNKIYFVSLNSGCTEEENITEFRTK